MLKSQSLNKMTDINNRTINNWEQDEGKASSSLRRSPSSTKDTDLGRILVCCLCSIKHIWYMAYFLASSLSSYLPKIGGYVGNNHRLSLAFSETFKKSLNRRECITLINMLSYFKFSPKWQR